MRKYRLSPVFSVWALAAIFLVPLGARADQAADDLAQLQQKADSGDPDAQQDLGGRYEEGKGVPKDIKKAFYWYEKAAKVSPNAQCNLGLIYYTGRSGVPQDYAKALPWLQKAANNGSDNAQNLLATMYENGWGTKKDLGMAVSWYVQSGNNNNTNAQFRLGQLYEEGTSVSKDYAKAVGWYQKAAKLESHAQYRLGTIYLNGEDGVKKDLAQAADLIQKSANQEFQDAENKLGEMYEKGTGVKQSKSDALKWYQRGADHGSAEAKANLARLKGN